jgi:hypothetical protein
MRLQHDFGTAVFLAIEQIVRLGASLYRLGMYSLNETL